MVSKFVFGKLERVALTEAHNHGKFTLSRRSPRADYLVEQGLLTREGEATYRITPAGEARLLDRSDVSDADEAAIRRAAIEHHLRE